MESDEDYFCFNCFDHFGTYVMMLTHQQTSSHSYNGMRYIPSGEGGSAWAESLLALRARALAKFGEVDTAPVSENSE